MLVGMRGQLVEGWVSGIQDFGFFVNLKVSRGEGLVRFNAMVDDRYFFDERTFSVRAQRSRLQLRLGDQVRVLLKKADIRTRQVDLAFFPDDQDDHF